MRTRIRIIKRETDEVVEEQFFDNERGLKAFWFYWNVQCNDEDFRVEEDEVEDEIDATLRAVVAVVEEAENRARS
jgi:hypothetical protein